MYRTQFSQAMETDGNPPTQVWTKGECHFPSGAVQAFLEYQRRRLVAEGGAPGMKADGHLCPPVVQGCSDTPGAGVGCGLPRGQHTKRLSLNLQAH